MKYDTTPLLWGTDEGFEDIRKERFTILFFITI
jgi:hypothetical protein